MGGVKTNYWGETNIEGLFASGEVASTGVHGANRLASNSLLEVLVFGKRIVERTLKGDAHLKAAPSQDVYTLKKRDTSDVKDTTLNVTALQSLLWDNVGIVRSGKELEEAANALAAWEKELEPATDRPSYELANMVTVGRLMAEAALIREESRGAHYRSDFPNASDAWLKHIVFRKKTVKSQK
jgi:L-aspartate oxidase